MELGKSLLDVKRKVQVGNTHKANSIEANKNGGLTRSSDEVSVMEMERRG
jgi:hypothetical protein